MNKKIITIFAGIILTIVSAHSYYNYKTKDINDYMIKSAKADAQGMKSQITAFMESSAKGSDKSNTLKKLLQANPNIAAISIVDKNGETEKFAKNDNIISSSATANYLSIEIKNDFPFQSITQKPLLKKYNHISIKKMLYAYQVSNKTGGVSIFFILNPDRLSIARMIIEIILLISLILICTALFNMILKKKNSNEDNDKKNVKIIDLTFRKKTVPADSEISNFNIDEAELHQIKEPDQNIVRNDLTGKHIEATETITSSLNDNVFDLFKKIKRELNTDSIILYIRKMDDRLNKSYELKGKTFLRIDSAVLDSIQISDLNNIKKSGALITENGTNIKLPVIQDESLLGLIEILLGENTSTIDLNNIKSLLKEFSTNVRDYLTINNVIINKGSGLFSNAYFKMKLNEINYKKETESNQYSIISIDLFHSNNVPLDQRDLVLKIIHSDILNISDKFTELYHDDDNIALIVENMDEQEITKAKSSLLETLSKFRIKLQSGVISLKPHVNIKNQ